MAHEDAGSFSVTFLTTVCLLCDLPSGGVTRARERARAREREREREIKREIERVREREVTCLPPS